MSHAHAAQHGNGSADHHDEHHHVVPLWVLAGVFAALLVLTVVTVLVSELQLGNIALLVALVVALVKGTLVCLFFMHLFWDSFFNSIALISALVFVTLFLGLAIFDSHAYHTNQTYFQAQQLSRAIGASESAEAPAPAHHDDKPHADPAAH